MAGPARAKVVTALHVTPHMAGAFVRGLVFGPSHRADIHAGAAQWVGGVGQVSGEEEAAGTSVTTVTATDADNDDIAYSITSGNSANKFLIDSVTGEVALQDTVDYETTASYTLTIQATDGTNTNTATLTVTCQKLNIGSIK